jgi:hypothetical protein
MEIELDQDDMKKISLDRSGVRHEHGREGFYFYLGPVCVNFYDERDAERLAVKILNRKGYEIELKGE